MNVNTAGDSSIHIWNEFLNSARKVKTLFSSMDVLEIKQA